MNLKSLKDETLLSETKRLALSERETLTKILHHLKEIERRKLYSPDFKSLFDYAVKTLNYTESEAYRRISAMRALKELPELEEKIESGALSLSNITLAQKLFREEKKQSQKIFSKEEKFEIFERLENQTTREAEKKILSLSSNTAVMSRPVQVRPLSETHHEVRFLAEKELLDKIEKLKGLLAHSHPHCSMQDLLHILCDLGIAKWDLGATREVKQQKNTVKPSLSKKPKIVDPALRGGQMLKGSLLELEQEHLKSSGVLVQECLKLSNVCGQRSRNSPLESPQGQPLPSRTSDGSNNIAKIDPKKNLRSKFLAQKKPRVAIPMSTRRAVWRKANSQCENCGSVYALEVDHLQAWAMDGTNDLGNLRLLCRACNIRSAIKDFGVKKIETFSTQC